MKPFIFISNEGYTYQPGSGSAEPDIENCQVIGFASGVDAQDAFINLVQENSYLIDTNFDEVICHELKTIECKYFSLKDCVKFLQK